MPINPHNDMDPDLTCSPGSDMEAKYLYRDTMIKDIIGHPSIELLTSIQAWCPVGAYHRVGVRSGCECGGDW